MPEPENHTLRVLQDLRRLLKALDAKVDRNHEETRSEAVAQRSRMDNIRQAINGESVLGRYAAAEVEERLGAIETRLSALEKAR